jgi:two-component system, NarL family, response regulator NreC
MKSTTYTRETIKIIVADDYELLRIAFVNTLQQQPFFEIVAEARNGEQLVQQTGLYKPDVVLADVKMPVMDGIEATRIITAKFPGTLVLACSFYNHEYLMAEMLYAGARGFVMKQVHPLELITAIRCVYNNEYFFCSHCRDKINKLITSKEYNLFTKERKPLLTQREKEILLLICDQKSNKDISGILKISVRTVEDFRSKLLFKTQSKSVAGLVGYAVEQGMYTP